MSIGLNFCAITSRNIIIRSGKNLDMQEGISTCDFMTSLYMVEKLKFDGGICKQAATWLPKIDNQIVRI